MLRDQQTACSPNLGALLRLRPLSSPDRDLKWRELRWIRNDCAAAHLTFMHSGGKLSRRIVMRRIRF